MIIRDMVEARMRPNRLSKIKQQQLEESPDLYVAPESVATVVVAGHKDLFDQLQAAMETDIARIKTVGKVAEKQEIKRELLPNYLPFIKDYIANGDDYPNSVAVTGMVWAFDIGDVELATDLGLYLITTGHQASPFKSGRTIETIMADEMYEWANKQLKEGRSASPYFDGMVIVMLADKWELPVPVISKTLAMMAKHEKAKGNYKDALDFCQKADQANPDGAGVKGLTKELTKLLKKDN